MASSGCQCGSHDSKCRVPVRMKETCCQFCKNTAGQCCCQCKCPECQGRRATEPTYVEAFLGCQTWKATAWKGRPVSPYLPLIVILTLGGRIHSDWTADARISMCAFGLCLWSRLESAVCSLATVVADERSKIRWCDPRPGHRHSRTRRPRPRAMPGFCSEPKRETGVEGTVIGRMTSEFWDQLQVD